MDDQNKNLILATALSFLVILVWFVLFPPEKPATIQPPAETAETAATGAVTGNGVALAPPAADAGSAARTPNDTATPPSLTTTPEESRDAALAATARIAIDTPSLTGSISLRGGRIDDLSLKTYHEELDPASPSVTLLSPAGGPNAYYALYGWAPGGDLAAEDVPGANTDWSVATGGTLSPDHPVTLRWDNGSGMTFRRTISVDENFIFDITQSVTNNTAEARRMAPYGVVARHGKPNVRGFFILHEGVVRASDGKLDETKYKAMPDYDYSEREGGNVAINAVEHDGWIGFTDKYWMTTLIAEPGQGFASVAKYSPGADIYQTEMRLPTLDVAPGATVEMSSMLFAGAKEWETIGNYERDRGIKGFIDSIDWGWFFFITKPMFWLLHTLEGLIGNMGWAIIALTLCVKSLLFPLAYKSYVSMAKMKELQPQIETLKEKAGDDKQKLQQEMMALYKKEKVNPASGCLPILMQVPIFFSLYKVIFVTIELRHAPWMGWIRDLSAPDPSSILNLFGLLPFVPPGIGSPLHILSLGVFPILLGISMWLQQKLNPAPTDPTQKMIFAWMPWVFMFMLGRFASGLVLYWITNNTLTFTQQYLIMRSHGYTPDVFGNIRSSFKRKTPDKK